METSMRSALWLLGCLLVATGCGQNAGVAPPELQPAANTVAAQEPSIAPAEPTKAPPAKVATPVAALPAEVPEDPAREPATVAQAAAVLDLATFPLLPEAKEPGVRRMASLVYQAKADVKAAYEFLKKALLERGFKELSDAQIYDQSASGSFGKDGFALSVSVSGGGEPGQVSVFMHNHGNLNLAKMPVPPGAKLSYSFPAVTSFSTTAPVAETAESVRKLLLEQGWRPYGSAGDSQHFKRNAIQLAARVMAPPAQPGTTSIDFTAELMSADLPAPADAERIQYADSNKRLDVQAVGSPDDVAAYYKQALAPAGWQATTDNRITDRKESFLIFRNPAKDLLTLNMWDLGDNKTRVDLTHQSAAEVEEVERRAKLAIEERKRKEEEERNRPKPTVAIALPPNASAVEATAQEIEFQVPSGKSQDALGDLMKQLTAAGWQADKPVGQREAGVVSFKKDEQELTIQHVDPGFIPAQITISARGKLQLEKKP